MDVGDIKAEVVFSVVSWQMDKEELKRVLHSCRFFMSPIAYYYVWSISSSVSAEILHKYLDYNGYF